MDDNPQQQQQQDEEVEQQQQKKNFTSKKTKKKTNEVNKLTVTFVELFIRVVFSTNYFAYNFEVVLFRKRKFQICMRWVIIAIAFRQ